MTKKKLGIGILVMALVFALTAVGCDTKSGGGGGGGSTTSAAKKITITGINGYTGEAYIVLFSGLSDIVNERFVAAGVGNISRNSVTFALMSDMDGTRAWAGSGSYYIAIGFDNSEDEFLYTNGKSILDASDNDYKYNITSTTSTIAFNLFKNFDF